MKKNQEELQEKIKEVVEETKNQIQDLKKEHKHNYKKDKNGWVIYRNQFKKKIKLRVFIRKRAQDLVFLDNYENIAEAREKLIEQYNEGGVNQVDEFVNLEFLKEIQITYDEMEDLKGKN